jgi:sugar phosphate isomerase/epimerase
MTATEHRIGASLDIRFDESIESFVAYLDDVGLNHVEIRQGYLDVKGQPGAETIAEVADAHDVSVTFHAPHIDCAMGNVNERLRRAAVDGVTHSLDMAGAVDAGGVVVHGGGSRRRYPDRVQSYSRSQAVRSIEECTRHAASVGVPLCLENSRETASKRHHTATPDRLASFLDDVEVAAADEFLKITLDVGHAKASGIPYERFLDRFGDRIRIVHLHDNDGTDDDHDPLPGFERVVADVDAPYNVLEMKSLADIAACIEG